jgi:hypothetical protein
MDDHRICATAPGSRHKWLGRSRLSPPHIQHADDGTASHVKAAAGAMRAAAIPDIDFTTPAVFHALISLVP